MAIIDFLNSPGFQKSLLNFTAGMNQGAISNPGASAGTLMGMGTQAAAKGTAEDLQRQIDFENEQKYQDMANAVMKNRLQSIMGFDTNPQAMAMGQDGTQASTAQQETPQAKLLRQSLGLMMSGDPRIMAMGQNMMGVASAMTPKETWTTAKETIDTPRGTIEVPVQVSSTGERKYPPYIDKWIEASKPNLEYNSDLQKYVDKTTGKQVSGQAIAQPAVSTGVQPGIQQLNTENLFAGMPSGLTPKAQQEFKMKEAERVAKEQGELALTEKKDILKRTQEAKDYLKPSNLEPVISGIEKSNKLISDLETNINEFNKNIPIDVPAAKRFAIEQWGSESGVKIKQDVNNLFIETMKSMKASGVNPNQIANTEKEGERILSTVLDVTAPKAAQLDALQRLKDWQSSVQNQIQNTIKENTDLTKQSLPEEYATRLGGLKPVTKNKAGYEIGSVVEIKGKKYKVIGEDQYLPQ